MTPHPNDLRRIYAVERQDRGAPLFWCGEDRWRGLDDEPKLIRRFTTPEDAMEAYDRYFRSTGRRQPLADAVDVGVKPGVLCVCGKLRFTSRREAERVLVQLWKDRSIRRVERRVYECDRVPGVWHMTKQRLHVNETR